MSSHHLREDCFKQNLHSFQEFSVVTRITMVQFADLLGRLLLYGEIPDLDFANDR